MAERPLVLADFDYELPPELIAQEPVGVRGESRLLVVERAAGTQGGKAAGDAVRDAMFGDLLALIPAGDLLVLNFHTCAHARLLGTRPSGGEAEVLLIHPGADDTWIAMGRPGSALRPGKRIALGPGVFVETVAVLDDGNRIVRFAGTSAESAIAQFGRLPLPPYITHAPGAIDEERYQTVYAGGRGRSRHQPRGCTLPVRCWPDSPMPGCKSRNSISKWARERSSRSSRRTCADT